MQRNRIGKLFFQNFVLQRINAEKISFLLQGRVNHPVIFNAFYKFRLRLFVGETGKFRQFCFGFNHQGQNFFVFINTFDKNNRMIAEIFFNHHPARPGDVGRVQYRYLTGTGKIRPGRFYIGQRKIVSHLTGGFISRVVKISGKRLLYRQMFASQVAVIEYFGRNPIFS
ncbi:MAG: hypothetical protein BWY90_01280 [Deltaproteobacteria bacterium ADurb.BinA014]|nr:MAG: hypothetical protein BWY90_01280 [Deltaproteobacteria bacterium ADurb.BinA014]